MPPNKERGTLSLPQQTTPATEQPPQTDLTDTGAPPVSDAERLGLAPMAASTTTEAPTEPTASSEPVNIVEEEVSVAAVASQGRDALIKQLQQHRERTEAKVYTPPPMTERQMTQREAEMEAGRKAQARHAAQAAARPVPPHDPSVGRMTPVPRDGTHVPKM